MEVIFSLINTHIINLIISTHKNSDFYISETLLKSIEICLCCDQAYKPTDEMYLKQTFLLVNGLSN